MVRITRVYTRKGDKGTTTLLTSSRIPKNSNAINSIGLIDELNTFIGWTLVAAPDNFTVLKLQLLRIQNELFDMGADLCLEEKNTKAHYLREEAVAKLEAEIDEMNSPLPTLNSFILPGGNEFSARLHISRTVCRRAERAIVAFCEEIKNSWPLPYINRLSDWLFVAARDVNAKLEIPESLWTPSKID